MSNSLDRDQDRHSVGPDLGPNCLQRLQLMVYFVASGQKLNRGSYMNARILLSLYNKLRKRDKICGYRKNFITIFERS